MSIRDYAKSVGHKVVGKLTRRPDLEKDSSGARLSYRAYIDEGGNEYYKSRLCCIAIVTDDGGVI